MHFALEVPQRKTLRESFDGRNHTARVLWLTTIREKASRPANGTLAHIEDTIGLNAAVDHLAAIGGSEIQFPLATVVAQYGEAV